ncbi:hypothetical protein, conserved [Babesia bigemina]|uniref:Uncharacterized protein n=1 Tax=Babesia bigemina TaxID=5866 RepID=A0A061D2W6_BABBI|nr:hypothetical protein, conserved [Babesia bigemina]CDR95116.1 hypothetical protein, conserved [Babesia bigemina]|eukprot:XP_012767302.1 hypothetical protein, conserved [Babesia bigemina]
MRITCTWKLLVYALALHAADCAGILRRTVAPTLPLRPNVVPLSRGAIALAVTRELALSGPCVSENKSRAKHRKIAAQNPDLDAAIAFYAKQHDRILRELLLPALKDLSTKGTEIPRGQPKRKEFEWDIAVSTEAAPLQCAILADVPPGTVLVRPRTDRDDTTPCEYVAVEALNGLLRLQPSNLNRLFPGATMSDVEKLYAHASLATTLLAYLSYNWKLRRVVTALLVAGAAAAVRHVVIDIVLALLRSKLMWQPHVYGLWSRLYHTPAPLMLLTAKRAAELALEAFVAVEEYVHQRGVELESYMLNADLHNAVLRPAVVRDHRGGTRRYETLFNAGAHAA